MGGFDTSDPTYADVQLHSPGSVLYVPGGTDGTDGDWLRKQVDSVHAGGISQKGTTWYEISGTLEEARRALANAISKAHAAGWQGDTAEAAIRNLTQLHATAESLSATSSKLSTALHGVGQAFSAAQAKSIDDDNAGTVYQQLIDDVNHNGLDALPTDTQVCIPQNSGENTYSGRPGPGGPGPGLPSGMPGPGPGGPGPRIPQIKDPTGPKNPHIKDPTEPRPPGGPGPGGIGDWPVGPGPGAAGPGGIGSQLPTLDTSSSLAGYYPAGGPGGGIGAGGLGGGAGGLGAGGLGAGGLGSGAGPDGLAGGGLAGAGSAAGGMGPAVGTGADAAAARNASGGRGMIAPMHGAGQGGDDDERERTTWLTEDDDVWGTSDAPPPVIS